MKFTSIAFASILASRASCASSAAADPKVSRDTAERTGAAADVLKPKASGNSNDAIIAKVLPLKDAPHALHQGEPFAFADDLATKADLASVDDVASVEERELDTLNPLPLLRGKDSDHQSNRKLQDDWTAVGGAFSRTPAKGNLHRVDISADGTIVVAGSQYVSPNDVDNFLMREWDGSNWVIRGASNADPSQSRPLPSISGDGNVLAVSALNIRKIWFWDAPTQKYGNVHPFGVSDPNGFQCHKISKDGSTFFYADSNPLKAYIYRYNGSDWVEEIQWTITHANICDISADGNRVGFGGNRDRMDFKQFNLELGSWENVASPQISKPCRGTFTCDFSMFNVAISADGSRVVGATDRYFYYGQGHDGHVFGTEVFEWDYLNKKLVEKFPITNLDSWSVAVVDSHGENTGPGAVSISHDGKRVALRAYASNKSILRVLEDQGGSGGWTKIQEIVAPDVPGIRKDGVALNCDGTVVAFSDHDKIKVYKDPAGTNTANCIESSLGGTTYGNTAWSAITSSPTAQPTTSAPTPAPWDIMFTDMNANFTFGSTDELVLMYEIGRDRAYTTKLYAEGCESGSESGRVDVDIGVLLTPLNDIADTTSSTPSMSTLTLTYNFNKTNIASSNIWNAEANKIELCQVVKLTYPDSEGNSMTITEDIRNVTIDFDLFVNFSIDDNITLADAIINANNATTDVDGFISAFHCDGTTMNKVDLDLAPNNVLYVCIQSESLDVEIAKLNTMVIKGVNPAGLADELDVISEDVGPTYPAFTSLEYVNATSVLVSTRVPTSEFDYEDSGASIAVEGTLTMQLTGSAGTTERKLKLAGTSRKVQADVVNEEGSFELTVNLKSEAAVEEEIVMMNSAKAVASKSFAILGTLFAATYALR